MNLNGVVAMNRLLVLGVLSFTMHLGGCAAHMDDPLPETVPEEPEAAPEQPLDGAGSFPREERPPYSGPLTGAVATSLRGPSASASCAHHHDHEAGRNCEAMAASPSIGWDDLLICLPCVADRYRAIAPVSAQSTK